jgi:hypothetical protein
MLTIALIYMNVYGLLGQDVILSFDAPAARTMQHSVILECPGAKLVIHNFGPRRPAEGDVVLLFNGRRVRGSLAHALQQDLGRRAAVYRLGARCPAKHAQIVLLLNVGERSLDGSIDYQRASAIFSGGRIEQCTGLQKADEETFWFR